MGRVVHYFGKISVGVIELRSSLKVGDEIHIEGVNDNFKQVIKSIQVNHQDIANARAGDDVGLKVKKPVHVNDKVYKIIKN
ncbi:MAG: translation elongation factor-like protein [Parcubacteria group bacterium]|nr:translation elongation factor-like protein [Parcubacteria group bacterium]